MRLCCGQLSEDGASASDTSASKAKQEKPIASSRRWISSATAAGSVDSGHVKVATSGQRRSPILAKVSIHRWPSKVPSVDLRLD